MTPKTYNRTVKIREGGEEKETAEGREGGEGGEEEGRSYSDWLFTTDVLRKSKLLLFNVCVCVLHR